MRFDRVIEKMKRVQFFAPRGIYIFISPHMVENKLIATQLN